jgi:hypothetical protein
VRKIRESQGVPPASVIAFAAGAGSVPSRGTSQATKKGLPFSSFAWESRDAKSAGLLGAAGAVCTSGEEAGSRGSAWLKGTD